VVTVGDQGADLGGRTGTAFAWRRTEAEGGSEVEKKPGQNIRSPKWTIILGNPLQAKENLRSQSTTSRRIRRRPRWSWAYGRKRSRLWRRTEEVAILERPGTCVAVAGLLGVARSRAA
jgi:hypothetical protein